METAELWRFTVIMNKATAAQMRASLMMVDALKVAGLAFVPVPVLSDEDNNLLVAQAQRRLEMLAVAAEKNETKNHDN